MILDFNEFINEAVSTKNFLLYLQNNNGLAPMDNGARYYFCKILDDTNFDLDKFPKFKEQIKNQGLYGRVYATGITDSQPGELIDPETLPIFGRSDAYETKWFGDMNTVVNKDLKDRTFRLKARIEFFK